MPSLADFGNFLSNDVLPLAQVALPAVAGALGSSRWSGGRGALASGLAGGATGLNAMMETRASQQKAQQDALYKHALIGQIDIQNKIGQEKIDEDERRNKAFGNLRPEDQKKFGTPELWGDAMKNTIISQSGLPALQSAATALYNTPGGKTYMTERGFPDPSKLPPDANVLGTLISGYKYEAPDVVKARQLEAKKTEEEIAGTLPPRRVDISGAGERAGEATTGRLKATAAFEETAPVMAFHKNIATMKLDSKGNIGALDSTLTPADIKAGKGVQLLPADMQNLRQAQTALKQVPQLRALITAGLPPRPTAGTKTGAYMTYTKRFSPEKLSALQASATLYADSIQRLATRTRPASTQIQTLKEQIIGPNATAESALNAMDAMDEVAKQVMTEYTATAGEAGAAATAGGAADLAGSATPDDRAAFEASMGF